MSLMRCPKCKRMFESERSDGMPFCSKRCRLADLYGWFTEEYAIPTDLETALEERLEESDDFSEENRSAEESEKRVRKNSGKNRK